MVSKGASELFQNVSTGVVVLVALTLLGLRIYDRSADERRVRAMTYGAVEDPGRYQTGGTFEGDSGAALTIVEFADFECPVCREAAPMLDSILAEYGGRVALRFKHYPLSFHKSARNAAVAAECATEQRAFKSYASLLWASSGELATEPWIKIAQQAGITDTAAFARCLSSDHSRARVTEDSASSAGLAIRGTPTFLIGTTQVTGLPAKRSELRDVIAKELAIAERARR